MKRTEMNRETSQYMTDNERIRRNPTLANMISDTVRVQNTEVVSVNDFSTRKCK